MIKRKVSKRQNAVSESDTDTIQELQDMKDSIIKNNPIDNQIYFSDSKTTSTSSIKGNRRIKNHTLTNQYAYITGINQKTY